MNRGNLSRRIAALIGNALASMRAAMTALNLRRHAFDAGAAPISHSDGYLPRCLRRRAAHGKRRVECVVIEDWMTWRR